MNSSRLRRVRELFEAASAAGAPARTALLDRECASDADLRREVVALLDADSAPHPVLDRPLVVPALAPGALAAGECVGRYRIVREIGAGGMGAVYLAERSDASSSQPVALKLVGWPSPEMAHRLAEESRILSCLQHPNIAQLLDTGITAAGLPFLVMEYVDGQPLDRYCSQSRLSMRERTRVFRQVCAAVRYLHQNLVIHRDLKPANILVTAGGVVKVVDFGVAKPLDPASSAAARGLTAAPMTPEYASPEQIRGGPLSTLSDVYGLGAILFEILAGVKPFRGGVLEVLRKVSEDDAPKPSAANPKARIPADLDTVVVKAMQKDPARRYASVEQLDEDLRRYLEGLPILARGESVWYGMRKFVERRKMLVAATAAVLVILAAGIVATHREARLAERERTRAEAKASEADRERLRALLNEGEAQRQRAEADRRLAELQTLAQGAARAYRAAAEPGSEETTALLAETTRDSLLALGREGTLRPELAPVLDAAVAELRSRELLSAAPWQVPKGWAAEALHRDQYRVGIDRQFRYQGRPSLFLRSLTAGASGGVSCYQDFGAARYRGKRVRLSAVLRTERGTALIGLYTSTGNRHQWQTAQATGSGPWTAREVVVDVPSDAGSIRITYVLLDVGTAWAADFEFQEVPLSVPLSAPLNGAAPRNLDFTFRPN
jgi:predicted Ser/Thr protein kinase